jgi:alkylated DNA repair dioxygenase AlkB
LGKDIKFDQLIINKYEVGQGISPHIDNPDIFGDTIASWW